MAIGEIVLGSFLSSIFEVLFDKLTSLALGYAKQEGISTTLIDDWKKMLGTINAVMDDAEDRQLSNNHLVKLWLEDVRDLAYDMEDFLDEFAIQATQVKSEAKSSTSRGRVNWNFSCFGEDKSSGSNLNPCSLISKSEVQKINGRLEEIITKKDRLNLRENVVAKFDNTNKRLPSTSLQEQWFLGREKEEADIVKLLTGEPENSDDTLCVVPIVGMGGVGKTALAQRLYNNVNVISSFEKRAWVCVSDVFDVLNITKSVLRLITELPLEDKDLNWLQVKLKDNLSGKKFIVVLDDIWNEKYEEWTTLLKPFLVGAKGSKILITTRNHSVASLTGGLSYPLERLSVDNCKSLLAFHALGATNFEMHPDLETIGKKIAKKCKGSPLAVKVLGGLLRNKGNPNEWEAILNDRMWDLPIGKNDEVLSALKLSYVHLPSYLKRYFTYCAVFPKDYEIERDELVLLWMAEGFLDGQKAKEETLKLGQTHFDELVSRSFLEPSSVDASKFSMHDFLNDLAKSIVGGTCFSSGESQPIVNEDDACLEKARYASFTTTEYVTSECMRGYHRMKVLRSLMLLHVEFSWGSQFHISNQVLHDLLTELKYLRVFLLCRCSIVEVPNCVGNLKHLRYLNFSYTDIERLPESIGTLCKLQALILKGCQKLSMLPQGITKVVSLQYLDISDTKSLKEMPSGIGSLKNLFILSKFVVGLDKRSRLKELRNLPHLQGELFISELQKVEEVRDVVDANMFGMQGLSNLVLEWGEDFGILKNNKHETQMLHSLRPHTNLENLTISCYSGARFASWLDSPSYSKIVSLCLLNCPNVTSLPSLGQLPLLRELSLECLHSISMISSEFYGSERPFPSLTTLIFGEMLSWRDWCHHVRGREEEVPFSCLQHLVVWSCPSLVGTLPCQLDCLMKFTICSCPHLNNSTSEVCLPSLRELYLEDCDVEILKSLVKLTSLTKLQIENLAELICFDYGFMSCLIKLKELHIGCCDKLTYLWQDGNETQYLTCLQELVIKSCPQFTSFVVGGGETKLPCNLKRLELKDCTSLEKLPSNKQTLRNLLIEDCPKLMGLNIPLDEHNSNNSMSQLKLLEIYYCKSLRSLSQCLHTLSHLTKLIIRGCPALEIDDFPSLPITLTVFWIGECPKLKSLPNQWHHLTSLQSLSVFSCPKIKCLPKEGLPPNLEQLTIRFCESLKQPMREWGLYMLTSLKTLTIDGSMGGEGEKVWFPSEEDGDAWSLLIPSSLTWLYIINMRNVERLSSGLCHFSLTLLGFEDCPKLQYLPEDGFPPSLQELEIRRCEILKYRCSKLTGDYWPLIQHIPLIEIDYHQIH